MWGTGRWELEQTGEDQICTPYEDSLLNRYTISPLQQHLCIDSCVISSCSSILPPAPALDSRSFCRYLLASEPSTRPFQRFLLVVFLEGGQSFFIRRAYDFRRRRNLQLTLADTCCQAFRPTCLQLRLVMLNFDYMKLPGKLRILEGDYMFLDDWRHLYFIRSPCR